MITIENEFLRITADPEHGGRITQFTGKVSGKELLWYDAARLPVDPKLDYDGNFAGGMDELLPCDLPEHGFPDHGELWTLPLEAVSGPDCITTSGTLPVSGLQYRRTLHLADRMLTADYILANPGRAGLDFLWKMHGALAIETGDVLSVPAGCVQAADPGDWSKAADGMPHRWPGEYKVGEMDGSSDFFYLTDLAAGRMALHRADGTVFTVSFDTKVFPCAWVFASFGRLNGSRTLIMEPCTNYPVSLDDAKKAKVCAHLEPGERLNTRVVWSIAEEEYEK